MGKKRTGFLFLVLILMVALTACGTNSTKTGSEDSGNNNNSQDNENKSGAGGKEKFKLIDSGVLTVASEGEFRPFSFMKKGEMVGYDVDVGEAIADKLGLKHKKVKAKFAGIVTGVRQHRYDIAVASHTITPKRQKQVDFSTPYYYSGPAIFTRPDSDIHTVDDLKDKEISVSRGSSYVSIAKKYTNRIPQVDSDVVALESLAKGHHDAVITDAVTGKTAIKNGIKIKMQGQLSVSKQAVAVAKDRPKLLKAVNKALKELRSEGKLKEFSKKWIGSDISKPPKKDQ